MKTYLVVFILILLGSTVYGQPNRTGTVPTRREALTGNSLGIHVLYGDLHVEGGDRESKKPLVYEVVLLQMGGTPVGRQFVAPGGRYRFRDLPNGTYELTVVVENNELSRQRIEIIASPYQQDFRQDLTLQWTPGASTKPGSVSATEYYKRSPANESLFIRSREATDQKRYDDAISALQQLVTQDPKDFLAWTELGTVYLYKQSLDESEQAYLKAISERPTFFLAQMNLGKLRFIRKKYEESIDPLTEAVKIQASSADANYYLGEAYLQLKKGSKAVGYLYEALKLDPIGRAEVHLHLAALYNAAKLKDKAAAEYVEFLKKKPDYPDRQKLEQYIAENKPAEGAKKP